MPNWIDHLFKTKNYATLSNLAKLHPLFSKKIFLDSLQDDMNAIFSGALSANDIACVKHLLEDGEIAPTYDQHASSAIQKQIKTYSEMLIKKYTQIRKLVIDNQETKEIYQQFKQRAIAKKKPKIHNFSNTNYKTLLKNIVEQQDSQLLNGQENNYRRISVLKALIAGLSKKHDKCTGYIRHNTACSICLETYNNTSQINFCSTGHSLCVRCFNHHGLEKCPECRQEFGDIKLSFCQRCCLIQEKTQFAWCPACDMTTIICNTCKEVPCCKTNIIWHSSHPDYATSKFMKMLTLNKQFAEYYTEKYENLFNEATRNIQKALFEKAQEIDRLDIKHKIIIARYEELKPEFDKLAKQLSTSSLSVAQYQRYCVLGTDINECHHREKELVDHISALKREHQELGTSLLHEEERHKTLLMKQLKIIHLMLFN